MKRWMLLLLSLLLLPSLGACLESRPETVSTTAETVPAQTASPETMPPEETTADPEAPTIVDVLPPVVATEPTEQETYFVEQTQPTIPAEPADTDFVRVLDYLPQIRQELRYATEYNFTGQKIYSFTDAYLRYGTVKRLAGVVADLAQMGMYLKIWDAFRPVSAQYTLWAVYPDPNFVANPTVGYSSHSRGNTVDVTLVDAQGQEFPMPTGFDDFSAKADRDYSDCTQEEANNAQILELIMQKHGFSGYFGEWWHFADTDTYPVEGEFEPPVG